MDDVNQSNDMDETTESNDMDEITESPPSPPITTTTSITHIYIGSIKKEMTVVEFADGSAGKGFTYNVFRKMLEDFLNQFYAAHELPHDRYLKVQSDQKVTSKIL